MQDAILVEKSDLKRVCFISDTHLTSEHFESESLFPRQLKKLKNNDAIKLYDDIRQGVEFAYSKTLNEIKNSRWDLIIHLGDVTGGYQEKGYVHDSVKHLAKKCIEDLRKISDSIRVCAGNHDIGFESGLPFVTIDNFNLCNEIFGDLFWQEKIGNITLIGLCSSLVSYSGQDQNILNLKQRQKKFFEGSLERSERFIICIHDIYSLEHFSNELSKDIDKLECVIFGDLHHPNSKDFARRKYMLLNPIPNEKNYIMLECLRRGICCPSSAPLWWKGGGYIEGHFNGAIQELNVKNIQMEISLPTSSFLRCAWWRYGFF